MKIGLIGLGIMGKPMAKNMLKAGYDLTVSDLNKANVDEVVAAGAKAASNKEIGETCDVVMTSWLPTSRLEAQMPPVPGSALTSLPHAVPSGLSMRKKMPVLLW